MSLARHLEMISLPCIQPPGSAVDEVSPLQCLADCRYNNHFTQCRTGTTLGKAMAAVKQHIRNRCSSSTHHEGICAAVLTSPSRVAEVTSKWHIQALESLKESQVQSYSAASL
ncbi:uncharacterized protein PRD47_014441 isoform 1-T1 [Ara ararauna]